MTGLRSHKSLIIIIWLALSWPLIYEGIRFKKYKNKEGSAYNDPQLTGLVLQNEEPQFNWSDWFSGYYQQVRGTYWQDHWSLKGISVRLNNQLFYSIFNTLRTKGFVSGKNHYVFSENYIFSAFGDDVLPEGTVFEQMRKARVVKDSLHAHGVELLLVWAPGKGMGCREHIADKYVHPVSLTNTQRYVKAAQHWGLQTLNLYRWFEQLKASAPYPLFPKYGHHWSYYGECLAVDTIIRHIEWLTHTDLPDFFIRSIEVSDTARERDADVLKSMNLYRPPQQDVPLAYPIVEFEQNEQKNRFPILTIADSYWYGPVYMGIQQNCFGNGSFWYYNNKIVPKPENASEAWELDLKSELLRHKAVMLLYSDANLLDFGNRFIESAYALFVNPNQYYQSVEKNRNFKNAQKLVRQNPFLLKVATVQSELKNISLDSAIKLQARTLLTNTP